MATYHINIRTDTDIAETLTVEREDLTAFRVETTRFVGEYLTHGAEKIWTDEIWQVDVTDANGLILYVIHVSAMRSSATLSR